MEDRAPDAFDEAVATVREAGERGLPLKLIGGQAVRLLCPEFPHRARIDQDMDFASVSSAKRNLMGFFAERGFVGDQRFNTLHGDRQMLFTTSDGRTSVDVVMDRLNMCHVLEFAHRIDRLPSTLDVTDLLLSKLQIVEINRKDVHDMLHLLSGFEARGGDEPGTIGLGRIEEVVAGDWGWWRTTTENLDKLARLADGEHRDLVPEARRFDPVRQIEAIRRACEEVPKTLRWKLRAKVGDRVRWYELPEEGGH